MVFSAGLETLSCATSYIRFVYSFLLEYYWELTTSQVVETLTAACRIINGVIQPHNPSILYVRNFTNGIGYIVK